MWWVTFSQTKKRDLGESYRLLTRAFIILLLVRIFFSFTITSNLITAPNRFFTQFPTYLRLNEPELEVAQHLQYILLRGMEVLHHHPSGVVLKAILSFDQRHQRLLLTSTERGFFGMGPAKTPSVRSRLTNFCLSIYLCTELLLSLLYAVHKCSRHSRSSSW